MVAGRETPFDVRHIPTGSQDSSGLRGEVTIVTSLVDPKNLPAVVTDGE